MSSMIEQIDEYMELYTVKQLLQTVGFLCYERANSARKKDDRDMAKEWQHTAMWINSIVKKVTV